MNAKTNDAVYYDPYDTELLADPYPAFRRLREQAPLYYNERYDFYALSRFTDVERAMSDHETFSSGRGGILEIIKNNIPLPPGFFIFKDPPIHTVYRSLISRVFTPKKVAMLEPKIREFCAHALDPLVGTGGFDFVANLSAEMPMRVIGMLLGIPEQDLLTVRDRVDDNLHLTTEPGQPMQFADDYVAGELFEDYIEWRTKHPSDDLMTELLHVEFMDETNTKRRLTREEVRVFVNLLAGAGNETTNRMIGWAGKILAEHPDQRAQLVENRSLIPNAVEEILRYEPPGPHMARYVTRDTEYHGQTVPKGSAMLLIIASANRDNRRFPDGDRFDIHRQGHKHMTFGHGIHTCLGAALARLEGCVAIEEVLNRFPEWDIDWENAKLSSTSSVRGWDKLPVIC